MYFWLQVKLDYSALQGRNLVSESRTSGAISTMRLPELKELAQGLGIEVDPKARKADLIAAIREVRGPATRAVIR